MTGSSKTGFATKMLKTAFSRISSVSSRRNAFIGQTRTYLLRKGKPVETTAEEAVKAVKSFNRIYVHSIAAYPEVLMDALALRAPELRGVELVHLHLEKEPPTADPKLHGSFFHNNLFVGANMRSAVASGSSSYIPIFLSEVPTAIRQGYLAPDVAFLHLSPPDKHGYCTLGLEITSALAAAETAPILVAVINKHMPRTHGQSFIHYECLDYVVHHDSPLPQKPNAKLKETDRKIGEIIAGLVPDGATLQLGIGGVPDAVLASLTNHKDLGIHTEMFLSNAVKLMEKGIINNSKKRFLPGRTVTTFIMGDQAVYDFVDDNPSVNFLDGTACGLISEVG